MNIGYKIKILSILIWFIFLWSYFYNNREILISFSWNKNQEFSEYYIQKDNIYYRSTDELNRHIDTLLTGADTDSFRALWWQWFDMYVRDKSQARYGNLLMTGVDIKSFEIEGYFAFDKNKVYIMWLWSQVDRSTFWQTGTFYGDSKKIYIWTDIEYKPKDLYWKNIEVHVDSLKKVPCNDWLTDQYWNVVEVYVDKNRLFFDSKGLGASILFGMWTGFDYDTIECDESEIHDKYGMYAIIHGKNFLKITVLNRKL